MLFSKQQEFSDAQNLTATGASTNTIDLGATGTVLGAPAALVRDIGKGKPIPIVVKLDAAAGGTSPTLIVTVEIDTTDAFSSATVVATSPTVAGGAAGDEVWMDVYLPEGTNERYMRLNYTLGGTSPDYTLNAGIVMARTSNYTVPGA